MVFLAVAGTINIENGGGMERSLRDALLARKVLSFFLGNMPVNDYEIALYPYVVLQGTTRHT